MIFDAIELDYNIEMLARDDIKRFILQGSAEMNSFQHAFIAGLIKKYRPQKLVEIGIAAGGTTCFLHECIRRYKCESVVFSVDKFENYYRMPDKKTGYLIDEMSMSIGYEDIINVQNTLIGNAIPYVVDRIGCGIDFLLLDTTHSMPGELLDFLVCLSYLKSGAIVVLHDTISNIVNNNGSFATKLLFDVVKAKKILNFNENEEKFTRLPNIMAFEVTEETCSNARDILSALTVDWQYRLDDSEVKQYSHIIKKSFDEESGLFFENVAKIQTRNLLINQLTEYFDDSTLLIRWKKEESPVLVYGNGFWASLILELAELEELKIAGIVISDDRDVAKETKRNIQIFKISEIPDEFMNLKIVYAVDLKYKKQIESYISKRGLLFV